MTDGELKDDPLFYPWTGAASFGKKWAAGVIGAIKEKSVIADQKYTGNVSLSPVGRKVEHMSLTADQEIRARALECACRLFAGHMFKSGGSDAFDGCLAEFEAYIRGENAG